MCCLQSVLYARLLGRCVFCGRLVCDLISDLHLSVSWIKRHGDIGLVLCRRPTLRASTMHSRCSTTLRWRARAVLQRERPPPRPGPISRHLTTCGGHPCPLSKLACPCCMLCAELRLCHKGLPCPTAICATNGSQGP